VHQASHQSYGSPKIEQSLRQAGLGCGRKRIRRLMRQAGLSSKRVRCCKRTTRVKAQQRFAPNHLQQHFVAPAPNHVWLSDVTYVATQEGWLYLAVLDLCSRRIVGWAMAAQLTDELTLRAVQMALRQRHPQAHQLLHHSDRGTHYTSLDYQQLLADHHLNVIKPGVARAIHHMPLVTNRALVRH
jgi:putative transposase